jgi:glycerol-3-phosphate dehydrogenase
LAKPEGNEQSTKEISRHHKVMISSSGLITVIGGKWTTYRKMAEDTVDQAMLIGQLKASPCTTHNLPIFGYDESLNLTEDPLAVYGIEKQALLDLEDEIPVYGELISESLPLKASQVIWAVRHEMARTLEDMLARRVRGLFLDVNESLRIAPQVAQIMASELNESPDWIINQLTEFKAIAQHYQLVEH